MQEHGLTPDLSDRSLLHVSRDGIIHRSGSFYCSVTSNEKNCVTGKACQRSAAETSLDRRHLERSQRPSPASFLPINSFGFYNNSSLVENEDKSLLFASNVCWAVEDWGLSAKFICCLS